MSRGIRTKWDSNPQPSDYKSRARTTTQQYSRLPCINKRVLLYPTSYNKVALYFNNDFILVLPKCIICTCRHSTCECHGHAACLTSFRLYTYQGKKYTRAKSNSLTDPMESLPWNTKTDINTALTVAMFTTNFDRVTLAEEKVYMYVCSLPSYTPTSLLDSQDLYLQSILPKLNLLGLKKLLIMHQFSKFPYSIMKKKQGQLCIHDQCSTCISSLLLSSLIFFSVNLSLRLEQCWPAN